ncbi:MAG: hypothetical protein Q8K60_06375 [Parachlamydiaceae bacterium]|nr:hypothetical protein [Parachlamydiaceae bacterium]
MNTDKTIFPGYELQSVPFKKNEKVKLIENKEAEIGGVKRVVKDITNKVKEFFKDSTPAMKEFIGKAAAMIGGAALLAGIFASFVCVTTAFINPLTLIGIPIFLIGGFALAVPFAKINSAMNG